MGATTPEGAAAEDGAKVTTGAATAERRAGPTARGARCAASTRFKLQQGQQTWTAEAMRKPGGQRVRDGLDGEADDTGRVADAAEAIADADDDKAADEETAGAAPATSEAEPGEAEAESAPLPASATGRNTSTRRSVRPSDTSDSSARGIDVHAPKQS